MATDEVAEITLTLYFLRISRAKNQ